jgi:serine/threonine-protein kinase
MPQPLTRPVDGEATHRWPQYLPGGEYVLFTAHTLLNDFDEAVLEVVSVKTGKVKTILSGGYYGRYLPSGHLIYLRDGVLWGVTFDMGSLETRGSAKPLLDDIAVSTAWGTSRFDFSQTGVFVYRKPVMTKWPIVWLDRSGRRETILSTAKSYYTPRLSPDGHRLAVSEGGINRGNIVVYDLQHDRMTPITFDGQGHFGPVWTPDGEHLIYRSHYTATGEYALEWSKAAGGGTPLRLLTSKAAVLPYSISNDGRNLAYTTEKAGYDIWILPIDRGDPSHPKAGDPHPFATSPANELEPVFSPDGHWIAYGSNENRGSGLGSRLKIRPFTPAKEDPDQKWLFGVGVGYFPMWSRNGHELFYVKTPENRIMVVPYTTRGNSFIAGTPRVWSPEPVFITELFSSLDLSPDGKRFVTFPTPDKKDERDAVSHLSVLQNFFDEVRRRVP